ncbi:selenide, water dikinase SelD [Rhodobacteraceae bacterium F11138]|nr:selenide, water dikinase SelD [Rhodobacteraceae bacterium F11138]
MQQPPDLPLTHDLVLIGGGHTHALFLRQWGMRPLPGARVTLIAPGPTAAYSGMLPGFAAGHYARDELDIDLIRLARFAGARIVLGAAQGIDLNTRHVILPDRPPIAFDVCSVDVGITSDMPALPGFAEHAMPAKPLGRFAARWHAFLQRPEPPLVAVLGAGVAGAELAMAMAYALRDRDAKVTLIDRSDALETIGPGARQRILHHMQDLGIAVLTQCDVTAITKRAIQLADGRTVKANFVAGAAGARPHDWLAETGLALHNGFISVNAALQSSDPSVFAVGDCAHLTRSPRPKAGVYAVRQAPVLFDNICATLSDGAMRPYHAQTDYLKLISLGGKSALAERFGIPLSGSMMWRWKDHIDRKFMNRFRDLPVMGLADLPAVHTTGLAEAMGNKPMCGGCGAKVGKRALDDVLATLPTGRRDDITPLPGDDAALLHTGGARQVMTSDHLRAMVEDPVVMTRIAAVHALGDIWAMGADPQAATVTLILPRLSEPMQQRMLLEIMQAANSVMNDAGAQIVGGHTSVGSELTIGFTLTGLCPKPPITLAGGQPGDALILTKPLGSGVLMAAEMAGQAKGTWIAGALELMTQAQGMASRLLGQAHAMTDITGFGLAGHLQGLCAASGTGARLNPEAIPLMDGALEMARTGVRSTLFTANRSLVPTLPEGGAADLLFDPQTAGGLLAAVAAKDADATLKQLCAAGYPAARIGELTHGPVQLSLTTGG